MTRCWASARVSSEGRTREIASVLNCVLGAMRAIVLLTVQLLQTSTALKCGPMVSRRAAVAGLFGLPAAACAGNPLDFDSQVRVFLLR